MASRIPLFDLGNVVIQVDFRPFVAWLAERSSPQAPGRAEAFLQSSLFFDFEFGNISREEFSRRLTALYGIDASRDEVERRFCDIFPGPVEGMEALLEELAAQGPVYALSNINEVHLEWLWRQYPSLVRPFARIFASHEIRRRKPYPGIYREVASALSVAPGELLFFDDLEPNVQGARRAGLEAHVFSEAGQVKACKSNFKKWTIETGEGG